MADVVRLVSPAKIRKNPDNPRLIFRENELKELQDSIATQGILVPLTVYESGDDLIILDGERRWRCARRLGLAHIPVIVQPEPPRLQNIMMMFAIHHTRSEWDPLPTAFKLRELEQLYKEVEGTSPTEAQLAQLASMSRGEVRRLKSMLDLPQRYLDELMREADKPRSDQKLTVDHVLEARRGALALRKRYVIDENTEEQLRDAIVQKYKTGVIKNTVEPRQLARIGRSVERKEITPRAAASLVSRLIEDPTYSINQAFQDSIARSDYEHNLEQQANRLTDKLTEELDRGTRPAGALADALRDLRSIISRLLESR
jgi:ParB/RepB/Spo0J family partition protein